MIRNNLFISNFSRKICGVLDSVFCKCRKKYIVTAVISLLGFLAVVESLNYLYVETDEFSRKMFYSFYSEPDNIDNLFVGASHVYVDIDPAQLDALNGMNNFNMSISAMRLDTAYYLICEAAKKHKLSHVYLEMYYRFVGEKEGDLDSFANKRNGWLATDYMQWSRIRLTQMLDIGRAEKCLETWIPFVRYREHLFDSNYIDKIVRRKQSEEYKNYNYYDEDSRGIVEYRDKGFYYSTRVLAESELCCRRIVDLKQEKGIAESSEGYLRKIIEYCQKKKIDITLFVSPVYNLEILSTGDYDSYFQQLSRIAKEYDIDYFDFNLVKPEYLDIQKREYFRDGNHLNGKGASLYTPFLWQAMGETGEERKDYFCSSYTEKISLEAPQLYGFFYDVGEEGKGMLQCEIASNRNSGMEYRIIAMPEGKEPYMIQDFSENKRFELCIEEHGTILITVRLDEHEDWMENLKIDY